MAKNKQLRLSKTCCADVQTTFNMIYSLQQGPEMSLKEREIQL